MSGWRALFVFVVYPLRTNKQKHSHTLKTQFLLHIHTHICRILTHHTSDIRYVGWAENEGMYFSGGLRKVLRVIVGRITVYLHTHTHTHTYTHLHIHILVSLPIILTDAHTNKHAPTHTHKHTRTNTHAHTHTHTRTHTHTYTYTQATSTTSLVLHTPTHTFTSIHTYLHIRPLSIILTFRTSSNLTTTKHINLHYRRIETHTSDTYMMCVQIG